jgi:arylsulfatase A-like enzyme
MRAVRSDRWKLIANFEFAPAQEVPPDYNGNGKGYIEVARKLDLPPEQLYHPAFELYDLENDPYEGHNLAYEKAYQGIRDELIRTLREWMVDTDDPLIKGPIASAAYKNRIDEFKRI